MNQLQYRLLDSMIDGSRIHVSEEGRYPRINGAAVHPRTLVTLVHQGWVERPAGGRSYAITLAGRAAFHRWSTAWARQEKATRDRTGRKKVPD